MENNELPDKALANNELPDKALANNELVNLYPIPVCAHSFDPEVFLKYRDQIKKTLEDIGIDESEPFATTDDGSETNEQKTSIGFNVFKREDLFEFVGSYLVPEILLDYCASLSVKVPNQVRSSRICRLKKGEEKSFKDCGSVLSLIFAIECDLKDYIEIVNPAFYFQSAKLLPEKINSMNAQVIAFPLGGKAYLFPSFTNYKIRANEKDLIFVQIGLMYD